MDAKICELWLIFSINATLLMIPQQRELEDLFLQSGLEIKLQAIFDLPICNDP